MKDGFPRGKSAIVGAATFGLGESPGFTNMELAAHASLHALAQAGIQPNAVDGLFVVTMDDTMGGLTLAEYLGIQPPESTSAAVEPRPGRLRTSR